MKNIRREEFCSSRGCYSWATRHWWHRRIDSGQLATSTKTGLYVIGLINSGAICPDPTLYHRMLKCTQLGKVGEGRIVHTHLQNSAFFRNNLVMHNMVLNMYAKCGCLDDARELYDKMPSKT